MNGFVIARAVFVAVVVYAAMLIRPVEPVWASIALGSAVALIIVFAEARLRDAAVTSLLGGLLGFAVARTG